MSACRRVGVSAYRRIGVNSQANFISTTDLQQTSLSQKLEIRVGFLAETMSLILPHQIAGGR